MTEKDDWSFLNKILASANLILRPHQLSAHTSPARIEALFSNLQDDYRKFKEYPFADTVRLIEKTTDAQFQMAFLVLSYYARKNILTLTSSESGFSAFSEKELSVYSVLKKLALLDMYSAPELRLKLQSGDTAVDSFFKAYPGIMHGLSSIVTDEDVRPGIRHYLKKKEKTYHELFALAFGSVGGRFIVPVSDARQQELHFITRIEDKLRAHRNGLDFSGKNFTIASLEKGTRFMERLKILVPPHKNTPRNLPGNQYIRAVLARKSLSFNKRPVIFYAVFASHNEQYAAYGYDTQPVDAKEIIGYLDSALQDAGEKKGYILFCIASPTGFADGMGSPPGDTLTRYKSPDLSLCLFDLYNDKKYFNTADPTSVALSRLCDLRTDDEKVQKLQEILYQEMEHRILVNQSVSLDYCRKYVKAEAQDREMVKKIFYQYAREHNLKVIEPGRSGPVMVK